MILHNTKAEKINPATLESIQELVFTLISGLQSSKVLTASGAATTLQISKMGVITNLAVADFALPGNALFMLKNDGPAQIELEVKLADSDEWILTKFDPGWNPEILKAVKINVSADINLKYGY